jgi:tRNA(adenine34) deaminase
LKTDLEYLEIALAEAREASNKGEVPIGCVIVGEGGRIISRGHNLRETTRDPTSHAEMVALRGSAHQFESWRVERATLYVTLEPCPMCLAASSQARIERIVYAAKDAKGGALSLGYTIHEDTKLNHQFKVEYLPVAEAELILKEFFKARRLEKKSI